MAKVYDCFMFFNEFELLNIRLEELYDTVDFFILVEGALTHTGNYKPFYFADNKARFEKFNSKIIHRAIDLPPVGKEPWFGWGREIYQRTEINNVLASLNVNDDDVIISSDVDEIPKVSAIAGYLKRDDICCLEEKTYHYNLNCQLNTPTIDPKICRYKSLKSIGVSDLRYMHNASQLPVIKDAGWHFSFMGGTDKIIEKMRAYAHYDIRDPKMGIYVSRENVEYSVSNKKSLFLRDDIQYSHTSDYSDLPKYISNNLEYFKSLGWIID